MLFIIFIALGFVSAFFLIRKNADIHLINPQPKIATMASKFSIADAPSDSLKGQITSLSGVVKWQSRTATQAALITSSKQIQQGESLMTGENSTASLFFPDVQISLGPNSQLEVIQTLPMNAVFEQPSGTISYQVDKSTSLSIKSSILLINCKSGEFNVTVDKTSGKIIIKVLEGSLTTAYNDSTNFTTVENTTKGQDFILDLASRTSLIREIRSR